MGIRIAFIVTGLLAMAVTEAPAQDQAVSKPIRAAVVTGGHDFDAKVFPGLFAGQADIEATIVPQKDDSEIFENIEDWPYDVIVLYNMTQKISEKRQANFIALLRRGVGLVALHHAVAAFNQWPEYRKIIGANYFLVETVIDGQTFPRGTYKHDVHIQVDIADPAHPITRGVEPFALIDETYNTYTFDPAAKALLSTANPESARTLCHVKTYDKAKVCYLQLGHGPQAFSDANYQRLVAQAVRWTAGRLGE